MLNLVNPNLVSDALYDRTIGMLNRSPGEYGLYYKTCIIHMIDSVSRGYTTPMEAYEAIEQKYFPEHLKVRDSSYSHLL